MLERIWWVVSPRLLQDVSPLRLIPTFLTFLIMQKHQWKHTSLTSWLLLFGLLSDSLTRDDLMSARSPSSSELLSSAKICSLCGSPSSLNGIISSVAHSSGSPPPDNCGMFWFFSLTVSPREKKKRAETTEGKTPTRDPARVSDRPSLQPECRPGVTRLRGGVRTRGRCVFIGATGGVCRRPFTPRKFN